MKFKVGYVVGVLWEDAAECNEGDKWALAKAFRVGVVVEDNPKYVKLAGEIFEDGSWRDGITIPKCLILKVLGK